MSNSSSIRIHTGLEVRKMQIVATRLYELLRQLEDVPLLDADCRTVEPFVRRYFQRFGLTSAMQAYRGYPSAVSICINEVAIHGIPGERRIQRGDILTVDIAARSDGFVGDTAWTYVTPGVSRKTAAFNRDAWRAFRRTVVALGPGMSVRDIGSVAVDAASQFGLSIVPEFVGHGIGRELHEPPAIPFHKQENGGEFDEIIIRPGMILNIEPVFSAGDNRVELLEDGVGYRLVDGSMSAHFELSLAVTRKGTTVLQLGGVPADELPRDVPFGTIRH